MRGKVQLDGRLLNLLDLNVRPNFHRL